MATQEHENEILQTRIGGLGGSDAKMVYKVGERGLAALSNTDFRRLAVMTGKMLPESITPSVYMTAGHLFEDDMETIIEKQDKNIEREYYLEKKVLGDAQPFKTFAHADFYNPETQCVAECKFSQKSTEELGAEYYAQLQWYYMLGVKSVVLCHGIGEADPYRLDDIDNIQVDRDDTYIAILLNGLRLIAEYLDGWKYEQPVEQLAENMVGDIAQTFEKLDNLQYSVAKMQETIAEYKEQVRQYMERNQATKIITTHYTFTLSRPSVAKEFNKEQAFIDYPQLKDDKYFKQVERNGSLTIKANKNESK